MKPAIKNTAKKGLALIICVALSVSAFFGCGNKQTSNDSSDSERKTETSATTTMPEITITTIQPSEPPENIKQVDYGEINDVYTLVCSSVANKLENAGFLTECGYAHSAEDFDARGICYYNDSIELFDDSSLQSVGFVEVINGALAENNEHSESEIITVTGGDNNKERICTYNYENIGSSHFVYQNKYVKFEQTSPLKVVYTETDNDPEKYDLELGSLFDYDNKEYIYDEDIFTGRYAEHSWTELFDDKDYETIDLGLKKIIEEQNKNGYSVEECNIVYISPESLKAAIDSETESALLGCKISELTESFGKDTALEFSNGSFKAADINHSHLLGKLSDPRLIGDAVKVGIVLVKFSCNVIGCTNPVVKTILTVLNNPIVEEAIEIITAFVCELMNDLQSGVALEDSFMNAAGKTQENITKDMEFATAIVSTSYLADAVKPGAGKIIRSNVDELKTMWDTVDDLINDSNEYSWNETLYGSLRELTLDYIDKKINKEFLKTGSTNGMMSFSKTNSVDIESMDGTAVKLLPEIYGLLAS